MLVDTGATATDAAATSSGCCVERFDIEHTTLQVDHRDDVISTDALRETTHPGHPSHESR